MGYIYKITNIQNKKCYIGETEQYNYNKRWSKHLFLETNLNHYETYRENINNQWKKLIYRLQ